MSNEEIKAKELIEKFMPHMYCYMGSGMLSNDYDEKVAKDNAKQCALIAVDEIINAFSTLRNCVFTDDATNNDIDNEIAYWQKVKQSITNI
jgi:hypothetical protein